MKLETIKSDSCWGFDGTDDGRKNMIGEAESHCQYEIDSRLESSAKESAESFTMACADIQTL